MKKYRAVLGVACTIIALTLVGVILTRGVHFDILQPAGDIARQQRDLMVITLGQIRQMKSLLVEQPVQFSLRIPLLMGITLGQLCLTYPGL